MEWKQMYQDKLLSLEDAAGKIESGDTIWFGSANSQPTPLAEAIADRKDELRDVGIIGAMTLHNYKFFDASYRGKINYRTIFLVGVERMFAATGNVEYNAVNLSELYLSMQHMYKPNVMIANVAPMDEEGYFDFGPMGNFMNGQLVNDVDKIIVQVNNFMPRVNGEFGKVHVKDVTWICEKDMPMPLLPQGDSTEVEEKIAEHIIPMIPDGATLQIGLGGLANAVGFGLKDKKNLSVHSEMFTDSMVYLVKQGAITGDMTCAFAIGSEELNEFVNNGPVRFMPISHVNDTNEIAKHDNLVAINACLTVDLTGQVGSETLGFRLYSSVGGQMDFTRGAAKAKNGKGFLCLPSTVTKKDGTVDSRIVLEFAPGQGVSTPRAEVMYIVTEYGVADLWHQPNEERVKRMIAIAHPDFREQLRKGAIEKGLLRE